MSYRPEVIADSTGKWCGNALRFATYKEAYTSAYDLAMRWIAVRDYRAVESPDPVTHRLVEGRLEGVPWRGLDAHAQGWPREACPFYHDFQAQDRSDWLSQWDLAEHFTPAKKEA